MNAAFDNYYTYSLLPLIEDPGRHYITLYFMEGPDDIVIRINNEDILVTHQGDAGSCEILIQMAGLEGEVIRRIPVDLSVSMEEHLPEYSFMYRNMAMYENGSRKPFPLNPPVSRKYNRACMDVNGIVLENEDIVRVNYYPGYELVPGVDIRTIDFEARSSMEALTRIRDTAGRTGVYQHISELTNDLVTGTITSLKWKHGYINSVYFGDYYNVALHFGETEMEFNLSCSNMSISPVLAKFLSAKNGKEVMNMVAKAELLGFVVQEVPTLDDTCKEYLGDWQM